jgi:adenylate cyclase
VMARLFKAVILGSLTGVVGVVGSLAPLGFDLEEKAGLGLLFSLRGIRQSPPEVVIVALDHKSAENLNLPQKPRKWPRSIHARLVENLTKKGAAVIAFDLSFDEARSDEDDRIFAEAIHKAGNVVLCEYLKKEKTTLSDHRGSAVGSLNIERLVPPVPQLANSAVAMAPFPLPKVPVRVSRYWAFKTEAGEMPTLPIVVFQIFAMNVYEEFIQLLEKAGPSRAVSPLLARHAMISRRSVENIIRYIRGIFENDPFIGERMLKELGNGGSPSVDPKRIQILKSLIKMYHGPDSPYLNYYGPPGTITTIPYYRVLQTREEAAPGQERLDFSGKAVFVGFFEPLPPEQRDSFYTVFSGSSGSDITGVEIAATAFANLLEDKPVQPKNLWTQLAVVSLWGMAIGGVCYLLSTPASALSLLGLAALYLGLSAYQFKSTGAWYPLAAPLFIQCPLAFFGAVVWKSIELNKKIQIIKEAIPHLSDRAIEQFAKNIQDYGEIKYGICLYTDAEGYTTLSEKMGSEKLQELYRFMRTYFDILMKTVKHCGGLVSDTPGDSMLALWTTKEPDPALRNQACLAAINMLKAVEQFNQSCLEEMKLPTRIGIHCGYLLVGSIGKNPYQPVGDIVNTAERIEDANKQLGTRILVSEEVIHRLDGFLSRGLGRFLLKGKEQALSIHELVCRAEESSEEEKERCAKFAEPLEAFRRRSWLEAAGNFQELARVCGGDGPSHYYVEKCEQFRKKPPEESWDGVISMEEK